MIHILHRNKTPPCPLENTDYEEYCIIQFEPANESTCHCPHTELCKEFVCVMNDYKAHHGNIDPLAL